MTKFTPEEDFCNIAEKYLASIEELKSADQINKWCSQKTHGKIDKIIDELDPDTKMILINAIYFKGEWLLKFLNTDTSKRIFYNLNSEDNEVKVDTMVLTESFRYYENSEVQAIELSYREDSMSAIIILPQKKVDINNYIDSLTEKDKLSQILNKLAIEQVHLHLPKFKVIFKDSLVDELKNMGMKIAFTDKADFYAMSDGDIPLKIGDIIHKTFLEVNEDGTEAAAVTIVEMAKGEMPGEEKIYEMDVNRPFLFFLRNRQLPKGYEFMFMSKIEKLE